MVDLSKSSVVRNTCRKRLRKVFAEALKERGFDEQGNLVEVDALKKCLGSGGGWVRDEEKNTIALTGSLRLHVLSPFIAAKSEDIKKESGMLIEALLEGVKAELAQSHPKMERVNAGPSQWKLPPKTRKTQTVPRRTTPLKQTTPLVRRILPKLSSPQARPDDRSQRKAVDLGT